MKNFYKEGTWNAICDECGFKFKADKLKLRWDGLRVCEKDFEFRNPQDFIKMPEEQIAPPWTRPEATDTYTDVTYLDIDATTKDVIPP